MSVCAWACVCARARVRLRVRARSVLALNGGSLTDSHAYGAMAAAAQAVVQSAHPPANPLTYPYVRGWWCLEVGRARTRRSIGLRPSTGGAA